MVVVSVATLGFRISRDGLKLREGEIDAQEFRRRTGGNVGSVSGGVVGATYGAIAGSILPGLGTVLGGFAGGMLGEVGGGKLGRMAIEVLEERLGWVPAEDDGLGRPGPRSL
jgi:phage tail tape-measure protein